MKPLLHPTTVAALEKLAQADPELQLRTENALRALMGLGPLAAGPQDPAAPAAREAA